MENNEQMFSNNSFSDVKSSSEAQSAYNYYVHNLTNFRRSLNEKGLEYSEEENLIRQCWLNLIQSCKKVGYTNGHIERMAKLYGDSENK